MSVDVGYPVLRTTDPALALRTARRLVAVGETEEAQVHAEVALHSADEVLRARNLWPEAAFVRDGPLTWQDGEPEDPTGLLLGLLGRDLPTDPAVLGAHLPLRMDLWDQPLDSVEDDVAAVAARNAGLLNWWCLGWPEVPGLGLYADRKHAEVSVLFNTPTPDLDERAGDHTVLVHVRSRGDEDYQLRQAAWVAAQAGLGVIGGGIRG